METYLFKFSACLAVFWLIYVIFLERQIMHRFKRFYLLGAIVSALIIPALTITHYIEPVVTDFEVTPEFIPTEASFVEIPVEQAPFLDLATVLWIIYGLGVLLFSVRFIINLFKMYKRVSSHKTIVQKPFIYVLLKECRIPHSFFKYLFFNKLKFETNAIPEEVKLHEETHAKQLHSLDIIVIELLQIVFWFHPLIYVLKHHIKLNHEFLADQAVLKLGTDTKTYQNILLQFSSNTQDYQLSSTINYSSIKKRFTVMKTQTSKTRIWLSTILLLPIIAILFYSFSTKEYIEKDNTSELSQPHNENTKSNLFLVTVEKNGSSIELKCESGCRWSHLILESSSEPYIINDFGFSEGKTVETDIFTFSIKPSASGVELNGIKGTAWMDLAFSLKEKQKQAINQLGMTNNISKTKKAFKSKTLDIKAINDKLSVNNVNYDINNYAEILNSLTKNWTREDYKSSTISELEIKNCSQEFLDLLDAEFRKSDYFLITIQGSKPYPEKNELQKFEYIRNKQKATAKQIAVYNALAKTYNAQPKAQRVIPANDLRQLETIYRLMSDNEKAESLPFPECNLTSNQEEPIMWILINRKDELLVDDELGTLESINNKLKKLAKEGKSGSLVSIKYDPETSKEIISKVEALVKANKFKVLSFDISPVMVILINRNDELLVDDELGNLESIDNKLKKLAKEGESGRVVSIKYDPETSKEIISKVEALVKANKFKVVSFDVSKIPPPPPPPAPKNAGGKSGPIEINGATYYFIQENGKTTYFDRYGKIVDINRIPPPPPIPMEASPKQKAKMQKAQEAYNNARQEKGETNKDQITGFTEINGEKLYYISKNGETTYFNRYGNIVKMDNLPPPPPAPETTLDFVIRMAKANAKFFNEGKSISSDEAIALIKKNDKLNINAQTTDKEQPLIYISKKPIVIGVNGKVGEHISKNQEIILPIINGKIIKTGKLTMTLNEIKKLKLSLANGEITNFKFKIPGVKTQLLKGNTITSETIKNLNTAKTGDIIMVFDIKDNNDSKISPVGIEIID